MCVFIIFAIIGRVCCATSRAQHYYSISWESWSQEDHVECNQQLTGFLSVSFDGNANFYCCSWFVTSAAHLLPCLWNQQLHDHQPPIHIGRVECKPKTKISNKIESWEHNTAISYEPLCHSSIRFHFQRSAIAYRQYSARECFTFVGSSRCTFFTAERKCA